MTPVMGAHVPPCLLGHKSSVRFRARRPEAQFSDWDSAHMRAYQQKFTAQTLAFWQSRSMRILDTEDARQMLENTSGFFGLLAEWTPAINPNRVRQLVNKETIACGPEQSEVALQFKRNSSGI